MQNTSNCHENWNSSNYKCNAGVGPDGLSLDVSRNANFVHTKKIWLHQIPAIVMHIEIALIFILCNAGMDPGDSLDLCV